jgi:hypothetical protein
VDETKKYDDRIWCYPFQYADMGTFLGHEGMVVREATTTIDNNKNLSRAQPTTSDGTVRFNAISRRL